MLIKNEESRLHFQTIPYIKLVTVDQEHQSSCVVVVFFNG